MPFTRHFKIGSIAGNKLSSWPKGADGDITYASSQTVVVSNGVADPVPDYNNFTINNGVTVTFEPTDPTRPILIGAVNASIIGTVKLKNNDSTTSARNYIFTDPLGNNYNETRVAATAFGGGGGVGGAPLQTGGSGGSGSISGGGGGGGGTAFGQDGGAGGSSGSSGATPSSTNPGSGGAGNQASTSAGANGSNSKGGNGGIGYSGGGGGPWNDFFGNITAGGGGGGGGNKGGACHSLYFNAHNLTGTGLFDLRGANGQAGRNGGNGGGTTGQVKGGGGGGGGGPGGNGGLLWKIIANDMSTVTVNVNAGSGGSFGSGGVGEGSGSTGGVGASGASGTAGQLFTS